MSLRSAWPDPAPEPPHATLALAPVRMLGWAAGACGRLIRRGDAACGKGDWAAARRAYRQALTLRPTLAPIWVQYGHALKHTGDLVAAERAYRHAVALDAGRADAQVQHGHALKLQGRVAEALAAFQRALDIDPGHVVAASEAASMEGRLANAARAALPAKAVPPADLQAALDAAAAAEATGDPDAAARLLAPLLRRYPAEPELRGRHAGLRRQANAAARDGVLAARGPEAADLPERLRFVAFGTTGLCNASCIHCPTGKAETAHVPRVPMPLPLFRRILEEMASLDLGVETQISLGLFGDGLVDPHVVERLHLLREYLPHVHVSVNTNGAAYDRRRHAILAQLTGMLALHVESLCPEIYDALMAPLRLARVMPKIEQILEDFPGRVHVSVPVSRLNREELPRINDWFLRRGAAVVCFDGLSSRCAEDRGTFDRLALNPVPIRCGPDALDDLIVDCDGKVMACCQDFQRIEAIGDLARDHLADVLLGPERRRMRAIFAAGRHAEVKTCSRCYGDPRMTPEQALRVPAPA